MKTGIGQAFGRLDYEGKEKVIIEWNVGQVFFVFNYEKVKALSLMLMGNTSKKVC